MCFCLIRIFKRQSRSPKELAKRPGKTILRGRGMLLPVTDVLQLTHSRTLPDGNVGAVVSTRHRTLWWCVRGDRDRTGRLRAACRLCVHITLPRHFGRRGDFASTSRARITFHARSLSPRGTRGLTLLPLQRITHHTLDASNVFMMLGACSSTAHPTLPCTSRRTPAFPARSSLHLALACCQ